VTAVIRPLVADVLLALGVGRGVVLFDAIGSDYRIERWRIQWTHAFHVILSVTGPVTESVTFGNR
jgi:hypothetical protein